MDSLSILALLVAFLLGSIPFGILLSKAFGMPDPRGYGSGNIGATNLLRSGRKEVAAFTMLLDMFKGFIAVVLVNNLSPSAEPIAMLLPVLGHVYSPWLGFKGGKGVATTFGVLFAVSSVVGFLSIVIWLLTFYGLRYSSLAALVAFSFAPIIMWGTADIFYVTCSVLLTALIFHTHRSNIERLMRGTEAKFELSKTPEPEPEISIEPPASIKDNSGE